jgi:hypothetical protein
VRASATKEHRQPDDSSAALNSKSLNQLAAPICGGFKFAALGISFPRLRASAFRTIKSWGLLAITVLRRFGVKAAISAWM